MPIELELPKRLKRNRWKVKIQEKETREPPHVSILRKTKKWRINLRTGEFLDKAPKPSEVPDELLALIRNSETWRWLCEQWDRKYPGNPVAGNED
ncbi:MAG: hypothetical protein WD851_21925 [Pirellulales bacterium]